MQFIGEVDGAVRRELACALEDELEGVQFEAQLRGCGVFPHRGPARVLWLGVEPTEQFAELARSTARILDRLGVDYERRRFFAHLALARFSHAPAQRPLEQWVVGHAVYRSPPFTVDGVNLYSSVRRGDGARYNVEGSGYLQPPFDLDAGITY